MVGIGATDTLEEYTLSEIIEINGLTEDQVLDYLVQQEYLILPVVI